MSRELERICEFYAEFNQAGLWQLSELYAEDCVFCDPVQEVKGLDGLVLYFDRMAASLNFCRFEFHSRIEESDHAFLSWTMHFSHPRLRNGATLALDGASELYFANGKILRQRDYYDMGAMLYENLPLLGKLIKFIKSKIA